MLIRCRYFRVTNGNRAGYQDFDGSTVETLLDPWLDWEGLQPDLPRLREEFRDQAEGSAADAALQTARL